MLLKMELMFVTIKQQEFNKNILTQRHTHTLKNLIILTDVIIYAHGVLMKSVVLKSNEN